MTADGEGDRDADRIEIVCRDREEFIEDYLMVVVEHDRRWCEEMATVYESLAGGDDADPYPTVMAPSEAAVLDLE